MLYVSAILALFWILGWLSTTDGQFDGCPTDIPDTRDHDPSKVCINPHPLSLTVFPWKVIKDSSTERRPTVNSDFIRTTLRQRGYYGDYKSMKFLKGALGFCFGCRCRDETYHVWHVTCHLLDRRGRHACSGSCTGYDPTVFNQLCTDICSETNTPVPTRDVDTDDTDDNDDNDDSDSVERVNTKLITSTRQIPTDLVSTSGTSREKTIPVWQPTSSQTPTITNTITAIVVRVLIPMLVIGIAIAGFILIFRRRKRQASKTKQKNISFDNTDYVSSENSRTGGQDSPTKISNINYDLTKDTIEGGRFNREDSLDAQGYSCLKTPQTNSDKKENIYEELEDDSYCRISDANIQFIPEHPALEQQD